MVGNRLVVRFDFDFVGILSKYVTILRLAVRLFDTCDLINVLTRVEDVHLRIVAPIFRGWVPKLGFFFGKTKTRIRRIF